ncbi:hypothetical protein JRQ81_006347 [Phrynocephalus forsythii]|uniref:Endonuclease/exonuclease/phosphatase domain-containing protein n=1 Tax=Phrynocephalus forsythii TaxID=171643 RepID=A0A9Q0Y612_9SAUR|nr:hypothetical protein JRQ81_006347 [Phrynocephalus forsythii]
MKSILAKYSIIPSRVFWDPVCSPLIHSQNNQNTCGKQSNHYNNQPAPSLTPDSKEAKGKTNTVQGTSKKHGLQEKSIYQISCRSVLPAHKDYRKGCYKAGLCCLIKSTLNITIKQLTSKPPFAQAFIFNCGSDQMVLLNVYIPPPSSSLSASDMWPALKSYIETLFGNYPSSSIIIGRDFNARLGSNNEKLAAFMKWDSEDLIPLTFQDFRISKDPVFNYAASQMIDLCSTFNLRILNGSTVSGSSGDFTFCSNKGQSVVDYILVSPNLFNKVTYFKIDTRIESDHLPILIHLQIEASNRLESHPDSTVQIHKRARWTNKTK